MLRRTGACAVALVVASALAECTSGVRQPIASTTSTAPSSTRRRASTTSPIPAWRTIGRSVQGRPLRALTLGHGARRVLWIGGIHGDEPQGRVATASLPEAFRRHRLGGSVTLTILEDANPDGRALGTRENANDIDLNRDFPATNFDRSNPENGGTPLSQPESRALYALIQRTKPDLVVSCHAFRGDHFVNFDGPARDLARRFSRLSGYRVEASGELGFGTPGSLGTLVGVDLGTAVITIEFPFNSDPTADWQTIRSAALDIIGG